MPRKIARARLIVRSKSKQTFVDPAQSGGCYARLTGTDLMILGVKNRPVFKANGVLAARWEGDETILLVIREEEEDEPTIVRAFQPRNHREWDTEDAHGIAHLPVSGKALAIVFTLPNPQVAVLPLGRVVQEYDAHSNLGTLAETVAWSEEGELTVQTPDQVLTYKFPAKRFTKTARTGA